MKRVLAALALVTSSALAQDQPRVFVASAETVDASNSKDKAKQIDFGVALSAALMKKKVPVLVVTDSSKAQWIIRSASSQREEKTGTKIFKLAMGNYSGNTHFEGTIQVIDIESSAVLYAYNVKKGNFQSAAEAFAKHFKGDYLEKQQ
ncbi:MAG: hypothetical protein ACKVZ0_13810 [Gemmatimonadales bacterium]